MLLYHPVPRTGASTDESHSRHVLVAPPVRSSSSVAIGRIRRCWSPPRRPGRSVPWIGRREERAGSREPLPTQPLRRTDDGVGHPVANSGESYATRRDIQVGRGGAERLVQSARYCAAAAARRDAPRVFSHQRWSQTVTPSSDSPGRTSGWRSPAATSGCCTTLARRSTGRRPPSRGSSPRHCSPGTTDAGSSASPEQDRCLRQMWESGPVSRDQSANASCIEAAPSAARTGASSAVHRSSVTVKTLPSLPVSVSTTVPSKRATIVSTR